MSAINYGDRVKISINDKVDLSDFVFDGVTGTVDNCTSDVIFVRFDECYRDKVDDYLAFSGSNYILMDRENVVVIG